MDTEDTFFHTYLSLQIWLIWWTISCCRCSTQRQEDQAGNIRPGILTWPPNNDGLHMGNQRIFPKWFHDMCYVFCVCVNVYIYNIYGVTAQDIYFCICLFLCVIIEICELLSITSLVWTRDGYDVEDQRCDLGSHENSEKP